MEFTNTFEGGLNKDSNILLQPRGTYRDMNNGMLVSYDGNDYVVELPKGTKLSFALPTVNYGNGTRSTVIGYISFLDTLVVFSTNSMTGGYGEIGQVTFDKDGNGDYVPLYGLNELNFAIEHQITGFSFEENDKIKRIYWTDNFNQPRALNVKDPAFTPVTTIQNGEKYMVVGGHINYDGNDYGPSGGPVNTNIFTGTAVTTYAVVQGNPKVYKYIDYQLLNWTPDRINPEIDFNKYVSGSLYGGSKSYFIRLSNKISGITSSWSYGTFPINVYSESLYGANDYNKVEGNGAGGVLSTTTVGVELKISNINLIYDTIEVAAAEYDQQNNVLRSANIFTEKEVTGETMYIQHVNEGGIELSLNDLTTFPASILRVKDITTNKNYNVIGNIEEAGELKDLVATDATISDLTYTVPADSSWYLFPGGGGNVSNSATNAGIPKQPSGGVSSGSLYFDGHYVVTGGAINHNGVNYGVGYPNNTFIAVNKNYTYVSGSPLVKACIRLSRYKPIGSSVNRYNVVELNDDFFDYRGMATTQYLRQYWSGETYRFAIIPYDKKGNPLYARWIGDKQIQSLSSKGGPIKYNGPTGSAGNTTSVNHSLRLNGIRISGLEFSQEDIDKMSGFSIVRAPRDKQYYAQGIMFPTVGTSLTTPAEIQQQPLASLSSAELYEQTGPSYNNFPRIINWFSPDSLFEYYNGAVGNYLEGECFVSIPNATPPSIADLYNLPQVGEYNSKWYSYFGSANQSYRIERYDVVNPGSGITGYEYGLNYGNNEATIAGNYPIKPDNKVVGCKTALLKIEGDIFLPNGLGGLNDGTNKDQTAKPLFNIKIPKSNLYGGQGADALQNTLYISTGHYQRIDSSVLADTYNSATDSYIFNEIDVFGGDSFLGIFGLGKGLYNDSFVDGDDIISISYAIFYPVESNINHYLRQGLNIQQYGMHPNNNGVYYNKNGEQHLEQFAVNVAYNSEGILTYPALPSSINFINQFPYRTRWAGPKTLGEGTDSFRIFPQNQFRDLDGNKGQINNVRNRDGKVFFWQDHAIGYLPMLERQVINGSIGDATQLGVSGVIDRFDNFNTYFGNQHKFGLIETEYGFAWFDFRRRAFLVMTVNGGIQEVSFIKGLRTFFNSPDQFYPRNLPDSYNLQSNDTPLLGIGISGVYDPNYKMTYMNFKWAERNDEEDIVPEIWKNLTIGYHHSRNVFVGFYDLKAAVWHNHNNLLIANKNIEQTTIQPSTHYNVGDVVYKNNFEYVCILEFTTSNPVTPFEDPAKPNSIYWVEIYASNYVHKLFYTNEYSRYFGIVYNHDIEFVINPKTGKPFAVDNLRQKSNDVNYDIIECVTDDDISTESTNNKWYRYIDKSWNSSVPLGSKGRLVDFYLKVKLTFKTYMDIPTNSRNLQKVFEFITSVFREKR